MWSARRIHCSYAVVFSPLCERLGLEQHCYQLIKEPTARVSGAKSSMKHRGNAGSGIASAGVSRTDGVVEHLWAAGTVILPPNKLCLEAPW